MVPTPAMGWKTIKKEPSMNEQNIKEALLQGSDNSQSIFRGYLRMNIREALCDLMFEEVKELCGPKYDPNEQSNYRRAGSEQGVVYMGGKKQRIGRPRVRQSNDEGQEQEVRLRTYEVARANRRIEADVTDCMAQGMSTRSFSRMGLQGASRSEVSRQWVERSARSIQRLRERSLGENMFFGLIIDAVFLAREIAVLVAIGLCVDGSKKVLDFEVGSSENHELCRQLLERLESRGFAFKGKPFAILDGSAPLEKAVLEFWPQAHIQRCLIHKERNLHAYLRRKDHAECSRLMDRLRKAQGPQAGKEALGELETFLSPRNQEALKSLREGGEKLMTLHLLDAPSTLNKSLLSTNLIENVMLNYRRKTSRVCRWRTDTDQVSRWTAEALLWSEEGFRKIVGYQDLPALLTALGFSLDPLPKPQPTALDPKESTPARSAPASCHPPCSPAQVSQSKLSRNAFLPQQKVGDKNALNNMKDSSQKLDLQPNL